MLKETTCSGGQGRLDSFDHQRQKLSLNQPPELQTTVPKMRNSLSSLDPEKRKDIEEEKGGIPDFAVTSFR